MDAFDWLPTIPDASIDLVLTDPPYPSLEKHRAIGTTTRLKRAWFPVIPYERFPTIFEHFYRILKPDTHCYVFSDWESLRPFASMGEVAGLRLWKPIVWDKVAMGMGYHYRARCEFILFFEKGKRALNRANVPDVIPVKRLNPRKAKPAEKPTELLRTLIAQSTNEGDLVCDPFGGSKATIFAAAQLGRRCCATDITWDAQDEALGHYPLGQLPLPLGHP